MNKRNALLSAAFATALGFSASQAHAVITTPASTGAAPSFAAEAIQPGTAVNYVPAGIVYTTVTAITPQVIAIILAVGTGNTIDCTAANLPSITVTAAAGAFTAPALRSCSGSEIHWTSTVAAGTAVGDRINIGTVAGTPLKFTATVLGVPGSNITATFSIKDTGETAFIDTTAAVTRVIAKSVNAVNIAANARDVATTADVNNAAGPLFGFVPNGAGNNADTANTAATTAVTIDNNSVAALDAGGVAAFNMNATGGSVTITITDTSVAALAPQLAAGGLCIDINNNFVPATGAGACETGEVFGVIGNAGSIVIQSINLPASGTLTTPRISYLSSLTAQLALVNNWALSGTVTPSVGAAHSFGDTNGFNGSFWLWGANATNLTTPWVTNFFSPGPTGANTFQNRLILTNTGAAPVRYNATCLAEAGQTVALGTNGTGVVPANGVLFLDFATVCVYGTASGTNARGSARFLMFALPGVTNGTWQQVNPQQTVTNVTLF